MDVITEKNPLPFITGTICAHACMGKCTRNFYEEPVNIRNTKLIAAQNGYDTVIGEIKAGTADGKKVAVVGGGNVAMDAARTAKRLGAKNVYIVYRRSDAEIPARAEEVHHAKEEGIIFKLLTNPVAVHGDNGSVKSLECVEMELGEPDASGRRRPIAKEGTNFTIDCGTVVIAIGQSPNPLIRQTTPGLDCQKWGGIIVEEETNHTSKEGVWAGGDVVTGAATVILAMGAGKKAAKAIDEKLSGE
mgnify:CR=1 FL=1